MKTALVLGGGGARGLAHVGVLKVLEQEKIKIDLIVGCSSGALFGAMYAQTPDIRFVEEQLFSFYEDRGKKDLGITFIRKRKEETEDYLRQFFNNLQERFLINIFASRISILKKERLENPIKYLLKKGDIKETEIPFACNATDLISGHPVLITEGDIHLAIRASSSIPGYFPPVQIDGKLLVDGAVSSNLPVKFARALGATHVIAVDVHPIIHRENNFRNIFDVIIRSNNIIGSILSEEVIPETEILINPLVGEYHWYEFDRHKEIIKAGEEAALLYLNEFKNYKKRDKSGALRRLLNPKD